MGRSSRNHHNKIPRSQTLPSSPTHSSSSSDFEFTVSISPRKSTTNLIPADQLFYKGQLLPLHLSPRLSMVRTLLLASSSTSSSDTTTTASRHSTASSSSDFPDSRDSSRRPSSVTDDDTNPNSHSLTRLLNNTTATTNSSSNNKKAKYFSLSRFSSVFRKEPKLATVVVTNCDTSSNTAATKRVSSTAKDVIRKYLKKVKPLYEKLSQKQNAFNKTTSPSMNHSNHAGSTNKYANVRVKESHTGTMSHSFSGNLRYPRRRSCVASCPSSMRSSPNHSGVLSRTAVTVMNKQFSGGGSTTPYSSEELHSAIQGAIAHCKNSMNINNNTGCSTSASPSVMVSNEI